MKNTQDRTAEFEEIFDRSKPERGWFDGKQTIGRNRVDECGVPTHQTGGFDGSSRKLQNLLWFSVSI